MSIEIHAKAPTRIDLAGGTLDLWPLYLLVPHSKTINVGINLFAETHLMVDSKNTSAGVTFESKDQKEKVTLTWKDFENYQPSPALELHAKLLKYFLNTHLKTPNSIHLSTQAQSPAGAGLGGSSTLAVSITGALQTLKQQKPFQPRTDLSDAHDLLDVVRDVETTVIKVPAGVQDYYGAMFGSLQSLKWLPGKMERTDLPTDSLKELKSRLILFYSGKSRNSGINNWDLYKALIDQNNTVHNLFKNIALATGELEVALKEKNWEGVGAAIKKEWESRRQLAKGISTSEIDLAFQSVSAAFRKHTLPEPCMKICGAGGGGCFFIYVSDPSTRDIVIEHATKEGMKYLDIELVPTGLETQFRHV